MGKPYLKKGAATLESLATAVLAVFTFIYN